MLKADTCGCVYLVHTGSATGVDVVFLVSACDTDTSCQWSFSEGLRPKDDSAGAERLTSVSPEHARRAFTAWSGLIADGYAMRTIHTALAFVSARTNQPPKEV